MQNKRLFLVGDRETVRIPVKVGSPEYISNHIINICHDIFHGDRMGTVRYA
jgi:hypothetical protein